MPAVTPRIVGQVTGLVASSVLNHWHYVGVGIWLQTIGGLGAEEETAGCAGSLSPPDREADKQPWATQTDCVAGPTHLQLWSVPTARSDRAYNWGQSAIAPDAVGKMVAEGLEIPFYLEYELRARHPEGVIARLSPYMSYYWSTEPGEDQPPFPTTLFVVDTEEVEATYVRTSARMTRMSLPILVSCMPVLSTTGILGRSWHPLWEPESPRLALSEMRAYQWDSLYHRMRHRPVWGNRSGRCVPMSPLSWLGAA